MNSNSHSLFLLKRSILENRVISRGREKIMNRQSTTFLTMGLILSLISKIIQFQSGAIIGDVLVLPAALCFVLAILFQNKNYRRWLNTDRKNKYARIFGWSCCLAVLSFQLLTMLRFGYNNRIGYIFVPLFIFFCCMSVVYVQKLRKQ
ncbi:MAG: hypothetical protein ACRCWQ_12275 [Bacilli bacterium]